MDTSFEYHRRYLLIIAGIILFSSAVIIGLNFYSIKILSSIRAYIKAESEYSKGQKDATRYLIDFIQTSDIESYKLFKQELSVPISDSIARLGLQQGAPYSVIKQAFLRARNHPADIDNLIWMFKKFRNLPYFREGLVKWTAADGYIGDLDRIGTRIYNLKSKQLEPAVQSALIVNVSTINRRLTNQQQQFSDILGEASRAIARWLIFINIFFIVLILTSAGVFVRNIFSQLVESRKLIIAQNNAKDEFMSIASHELKTPITSMKASLQVLERFARKSPENITMHPFIINANKQVNRLTELVKDLLDVTKIQSGKLIINKQPVLLHALIMDVINETTHTSKHKYVIEKLAEGCVNADADRIYQVVDNLLSNAAKYSGEYDPIHISSELVHGSIKVCVQDFGAGIAKEKIPLLFERFYRIEENKHAVQGLGLGLYICKEIINNHGGRIGVESETGKGSIFWFSLPVLIVPDEAPNPSSSLDEGYNDQAVSAQPV